MTQANPPPQSPTPIPKKTSTITERCTNCGDCSKVCPTHSIFRLETQHVIDTDTCEGCDVCIPICPEKAIRKL